jgi:hypothetical protein
LAGARGEFEQAIDLDGAVTLCTVVKVAGDLGDSGTKPLGARPESSKGRFVAGRSEAFNGPLVCLQLVAEVGPKEGVVNAPETEEGKH